MYLRSFYRSKKHPSPRAFGAPHFAHTRNYDCLPTGAVRPMPNFCPLGRQANAQFLAAWSVVISRWQTHTCTGLELLKPLVFRCCPRASFLPPARTLQAPRAGNPGGHGHASLQRCCSIHFGNRQFRFCRLLGPCCRERWESALGFDLAHICCNPDQRHAAVHGHGYWHH